MGYFEIWRFKMRPTVFPSQDKVTTASQPSGPSVFSCSWIFSKSTYRANVNTLNSIFPHHLRRPFCLPLVGLPERYEIRDFPKLICHASGGGLTGCAGAGEPTLKIAG